MPVCSYLVVPASGAQMRVGQRLTAIDGCEVVPARNRNVLILVTDTASPEEDERLRSRIEEIEEIEALMFTFGEVDPETELADPLARDRQRP